MSAVDRLTDYFRGIGQYESDIIRYGATHKTLFSPPQSAMIHPMPAQPTELVATRIGWACQRRQQRDNSRQFMMGDRLLQWSSEWVSSKPVSATLYAKMEGGLEHLLL